MKKETTLPDELARLLLLETDEDVKTEDDSPSLDYRRDIRSILTALYERAPYIYALFKAAPKTEFRIALTEDLSRGDLPDETYTIPEFCARYASFEPKGQIFLSASRSTARRRSARRYTVNTAKCSARPRARRSARSTAKTSIQRSKKSSASSRTT